MCWLLLLLFFWVFLVGSTYVLFYYEAANGSHLEVLRSHGRVGALLLRGMLLSLVSQVLLVVGLATMCRRRFWDLPSGPATRTPVVFVHGLYHNHTSWYLYLRWFRRWGWKHVKAVNLRGKFRSILDYAQMLAGEVERVVHETGSSQVDLVGHSMGGLVIRAYLARTQTEGRVRRVVTLGSPHAGSKMAVFGVGAAARELVPGSPFLKSLNGAASQTAAPERLVAIYSILDNMVLPNESAKLGGRGVTCLETRPVSHVGLLFCKRTCRLVERCLDER
jgi:pimeloyl-ACP methyl ester carboxylesterase